MWGVYVCMVCVICVIYVVRVCSRFQNQLQAYTGSLNLLLKLPRPKRENPPGIKKEASLQLF